MNIKEYYYLENNKPTGPVSLVELLEIIERDTMVWRVGIKWSLACDLDELKKFFPEVVVTSNTKQKTEYYYLENNKSVGPINLVELLERIDRETMVWREGIDWTTACELEELQKFFPNILRMPSPIISPSLNRPTIVSEPSLQESETATNGESTIESTQTKVTTNKVAKSPVDIKPQKAKSTKLVLPQKTDTPAKPSSKSTDVTSTVIENITATNKNKSQSINDSINLNDQLNSINSILTNLYDQLKENDKFVTGKLYIRPNINIKKLNALKNKIGDVVGNVSECIIHTDDTVFGAGDLGFLATTNLFAWNNVFSKPIFIKWEDIEVFKVGIKKTDSKKTELVLKSTKGEEYVINLVLLHHPETFAAALNKLLQLLK